MLFCNYSRAVPIQTPATIQRVSEPAVLAMNTLQVTQYPRTRSTTRLVHVVPLITSLCTCLERSNVTRTKQKFNSKART